MKKLKTFSRRSLLAAFMLLLFVTNSCKKDNLLKSTGNTNAITSIPSGQNIISDTRIKDGFTKNEIGKFLIRIILNPQAEVKCLRLT